MKNYLRQLKIIVFTLVILINFNYSTLSQTSEIWGLGRQSGGELGNGVITFENKLAIEYNGKKWLQIVPSEFSTVGIDLEGVLWVMGDVFLNENNLLDTIHFESEIKWKSVAVNRKNILATKEDGSLWLMGENNSNMQGVNMFIDAPSKVVTEKSDWVKLCPSFFEFYAIDSIGDVYEIKSINTFNSFTDGSTITIQKFRELSNVKEMKTIINGTSNALVCIKNDGSLLAKGTIFFDLNLPKYKVFDSFVDINTGFKVDEIINMTGYTNFIDKEGNNYLLDSYYDIYSKVEFLKVTSDLNLKFYYKSMNREYILDKNNTLYFKGLNKPTLLNTFDLYINDYIVIAQNVKHLFINQKTDLFQNYEGEVFSLRDEALNSNNLKFVGLTKISDNIKINGSFLNTANKYYNFNEIDNDYNLTSNYFIDSNNYLLGTGFNNLKLFGNNRNISELIKVDNDKWTYFTNCVNFGVGIKLDGTIWGIGNNNYNQLNDTSLFDIEFLNNFKIKKHYNLTQIDSETNWTKVVCSDNSVYALNNKGEVFTWGLSTSLITLDSNNFSKIKLDFKEFINDIQLSEFYLFAKSDSSLYYLKIQQSLNKNKIEPYKILKNEKIIDFQVTKDNLYVIDELQNVSYIGIISFEIFDLNYFDFEEKTIKPTFWMTIGTKIKKIAFTKNFGVMIDINNSLLAYGSNYNNMFNIIDMDYLNVGTYFNLENNWENCVSSGDNIILTRSNKLGIENSNSYSTIFPNPSSDKIIIDLGSADLADLVIYDILGNEILSILNYINKSEIDINNLSIGTYTIQIQSKNGRISHRLVVNR